MHFYTYDHEVLIKTVFIAFSNRTVKKKTDQGRCLLSFQVITPVKDLIKVKRLVFGFFFSSLLRVKHRMDSGAHGSPCRPNLTSVRRLKFRLWGRLPFSFRPPKR